MELREAVKDFNDLLMFLIWMAVFFDCGGTDESVVVDAFSIAAECPTFFFAHATRRFPKFNIAATATLFTLTSEIGFWNQQAAKLSPGLEMLYGAYLESMPQRIVSKATTIGISMLSDLLFFVSFRLIFRAIIEKINAPSSGHFGLCRPIPVTFNHCTNRHARPTRKNDDDLEPSSDAVTRNKLNRSPFNVELLQTWPGKPVPRLLPRMRTHEKMLFHQLPPPHPPDPIGDAVV
jgi:hypothetical protein